MKTGLMAGGIALLATLGLSFAAFAGPSQDSDGDGVFDVLDVPHQLTGSGAHLPSDDVYYFTGSASAQALPNRNSSGLQNDITINRISEAQFRVDGGQWKIAQQYGEYAAELDLRIPVPDNFNTIEIRTVTIDPGTVTAALIEWGEPDIAELRGRCAVIQGNAEAFPEAAIDICQLAIPDTATEQEEDPN